MPQRGGAIELVMETCSGAVVHTNQDIIQSPLGRVFPYSVGEKEVKIKNKFIAVISKTYFYYSYVPFCSVVYPALTLLWLPPPKYCVRGFGSRRQLDGHHLGLQEGTEVQLPQELPLDTIVGGELDNDT